jgi:uncharacterized metal-binding protein YceD (DUF177 family)
MIALSEYIIPFTSLKPGKNHLIYEIEGSFFKKFDYSDIEKCKLKVEVQVDKLSAMLVFDFKISGDVSSECDRCSDEMTVAVSNEERLIIKFGEETFDEVTDEIVILPQGTQEINLARYLYEYIHLSLPYRRAHSNEKECNQFVLQKLDELKQNKKNSSQETDPRWEVLKNLRF